MSEQSQKSVILTQLIFSGIRYKVFDVIYQYDNFGITGTEFLINIIFSYFIQLYILITRVDNEV